MRQPLRLSRPYSADWRLASGQKEKVMVALSFSLTPSASALTLG